MWCILFIAVLCASPAFAQETPDGEPPTAEGQDDNIVGDAGIGPLKPKKNKLLMRVHPLADGMLRTGSWTVLRLQVANGAPSMNATVRIVERDIEGGTDIPYSRQVQLPTGAVKEIDLYYRPGWNARVRKVELITPAGTREIEFLTQSVSEETVTIGVLGDDTFGLPIIQQTWPKAVPGNVPRPTADAERPVRTGLIPLASMPERSMGYAALNWIVWPEADPSRISPEQMAALQAWVADGGHLVVSVSDRWQTVSNSKLHNMLPIELTGVADGDTARLVAALSTTGADGGHWGVENPRLPSVEAQAPTPVATGTLRTGSGRWSQAIVRLDDDRPGWAIGSYGLGTVSVITANPGLTPLSKQITREQLWRRLLWLPPETEVGTAWLNGPLAGTANPSQVAPTLGYALKMHDHPYDSPWRNQNEYQYSGWDTDFGWEAELRESLSDMPGVAPLPLSWLIGFSLLYLFAIGPFDFFILRAFGKQPYTWITFPLTIAVFSTAALVGTSLIKGNQAVVQRLEVVDILPGTDLWRGDTFIGIFTTRKSEIRIRGGEIDALVVPLEESGYMTDPAITAQEGPGELVYRAETWTLGYANSRWVGPGKGRIEVTKGNGGPMVHSTLPWDLEDAELRMGSATIRIGTLVAGETRQLKWGVDEGYGLPTTADQGEAVVRHLLRYPDAGRGHLDISGWGVVLGVVRNPIEQLDIEGLAPESEAISLVRAPFALPTELDAHDAGSYTSAMQTVFDGEF